MNAILVAAAKPVAVVLLAGIVKFLFDYRMDHSLTADLIDGALTAALAASSFLGVNGVVSGVQTAQANAAAKAAATKE